MAHYLQDEIPHQGGSYESQINTVAQPTSTYSTGGWTTTLGPNLSACTPLEPDRFPQSATATAPAEKELVVTSPQQLIETVEEMLREDRQAGE